MFSRALVLTTTLLTGVWLAACSASTACDATTCADGCCGADGLCRPTGPSSCGVKGAVCADCTANRLGCFDGECLPYEQECVQNGGSCQLDGICCSQICSKGICATERCASGGSACTFGTQCCSGICNENVCTTTSCGAAGQGCSQLEPCCSPLQCSLANVCEPPCKGEGAMCAAPTDCCSGTCFMGQCAGPQTCRRENESCSPPQTECCSGLNCSGGTCRP